jgi:hypothetical protein
MQVAAQIAQAEAFNAAPKPATPGEQHLKIDIKQKVKTAK